MPDLVRIGAWGAMLGGGLRVASSLVPWRPENAGLETFYALIDVCLLLGLVGVYAFAGGRVGRLGLGAFVVALAGMASLVGPDASAFGVDFYRVGALVFLVGLAGLSVQLWRARELGPAPMLWVAALGVSVLSAVVRQPVVMMGAGVLLGLGFLFAGGAMVGPATRAAEA